MIIKILGVLDIFIALLFWIFVVFNVKSLAGLVLLSGLFLLMKGIVFIGSLNITSILDIIGSIVIIMGSSLQIPVILVIIVSLFLFQKGIFSLL